MQLQLPSSARSHSRDDERFLPGGHLDGEARIGVDDERRAVEDQLVLAADLVEIGERQPGLRDAGDGDVHAHVALLPVERRTVRHDQEFSAALGETLGDLVGPDVLADRHADLDAAKQDRSRQRAGVEHALLVEDAVVRQIDLEAHRRDPSAVEQRHRVVDLAGVGPHAADEHGGAGPEIGRELLDRGAAGGGERRLAHQILGRIAADVQLRQHEQIGALPRRVGTRANELFDVAGEIAENGIELGKRDLQGVGGGVRHGAQNRATGALGATRLFGCQIEVARLSASALPCVAGGRSGSAYHCCSIAAPTIGPASPCWTMIAHPSASDCLTAWWASLMVAAAPFHMPTGIHSRTTLW